MNTLDFIGNVSLNVSSFFYLILLIPQVVHNQKSQNIAGLSLWLHLLLYVSYSSDLLYAFADAMPLQYKMVAIFGLILVMTQHLQLLKFYIKQKYYVLTKLGLLFLMAHCALSYYLFVLLSQGPLNQKFVLVLGLMARGCEIIYCVPQIIKNEIYKSADAMSIHFIYLNILLAVLDTISAWCLNWEWPNKLVAPLSVIIMFIIYWQNKKYAVRIPAFNYKKRWLSLASSIS